MNVIRVIAALCTAVLLAASCGKAPESTSEPVGEVEQEVIGATCTNDASCTGYPPQHCCQVGFLKNCYAECDDHHCGGCSLNCASSGQHCKGGIDGHCSAICVECNSDSDCFSGAYCPQNGNNTCACISTSETRCGNTCKKLQTDENNCGSCGNVCGSGQACIDGACFDCPGGVCTSCVDAHDCPFKTKCEGGLPGPSVCTHRCYDHTACGDDELCVNSMCQMITATGATQADRDTFCRNTYDNGTNPSTWQMRSCSVGGSNLCVQLKASNTRTPGSGCTLAPCGNFPSTADVAAWGLTTDTGWGRVPTCSQWDSGGCMTSPGSGVPKATCVWKMCPAPAEGSTCSGGDYW